MRHYQSAASAVQNPNGGCPTLNMGGMHSSFVAMLFPQACVVSFSPDVIKIPSQASAALSRLSPRERQVAELASGGWSNKQIAHKLGTTPGTIKTQMTGVMRKLSIERRSALPIFIRGGEASAVTPRDVGLTPHQLRALRLAAEGKSNRQIAEVMEVTEGTVKCHMSAAYRAFGVRNRASAVSKFLSVTGG